MRIPSEVLKEHQSEIEERIFEDWYGIEQSRSGLREEEEDDKGYVLKEDNPIPIIEVPGEITEEEPEPRIVLGSYTGMSSPGLITLRFTSHEKVATRIFRKLMIAVTGEPGIDPDEFFSMETYKWIAYASMNVTYNHELFHHACDVFQHITPFIRRADPEEPMAVAFSLENFSPPDFPSGIGRKPRSWLRRFFLSERINPAWYPSPYDQFGSHLNWKNRLLPSSLLKYFGQNILSHNQTLLELLMAKICHRIGPLHVNAQILL